MDTSTGNVLYSEAADDILQLVKKKLETMPAALIPGTNATPKTNGMSPKTPAKTLGK